MKPGARVVFGVRSEKSLKSMPFVNYKFNVRTADEIVEIMNSNGFNDVDYSYHDEGEVMLGDIALLVVSYCLVYGGAFYLSMSLFYGMVTPPSPLIPTHLGDDRSP